MELIKAPKTDITHFEQHTHTHTESFFISLLLEVSELQCRTAAMDWSWGESPELPLRPRPPASCPLPDSNHLLRVITQLLSQHSSRVCT